MYRPTAALAELYHRAPAQLRGMILVAGSSFGFSAMHAMIRSLSSSLHPFEIAFFRNFFGLLALAPVFLRSGFNPLQTRRLPLHALRSLLQLGAMLMFFTALARTPLAKVSAMSFTAPLFASLGAVIFLGESIYARRVVALLIGFAGALVIVRPGLDVELGALLVLGSSAIWALAMLIIKRLSATDSSVTLTAFMGLFMAPLSLIPAALFWRWPAPREYLWLALIGITGMLSHILMAQGFREADATVVLPVDYTRLIWASTLGFVVFGEIPQATTWLGGTAIFASTTYIAYRESRTKTGIGRPTSAAVSQPRDGAERRPTTS